MSNSNSPQTLDFTNERGATRSTWIALALVIAIIGWMGSSFVFPAQDVDETYPISTDKISLVAVAVYPVNSRERHQVFLGRRPSPA